MTFSRPARQRGGEGMALKTGHAALASPPICGLPSTTMTDGKGFPHTPFLTEADTDSDTG